MHVPAYQRTIERFDEHDGFVRAAVGLVSLCRAFDRILAAHAPPTSAATNGAANAASEEGDVVLQALLGAIALRRTIGSHFETIAPERSKLGAPDVSAPHTKRDAAEGLLR